VSAASTYAEALYEAAADGSAVDAVARDLATFANAVDQSEQLQAALDSPEVDSVAKNRIVEALASDAHPLLVNFLRVLADRGRLAELPEIAEAFAARVARAENRIEVEAVTAVPLPDDLRRKIVERVRRTTGAEEVALIETVDPDIVGGLVLRVGGAVVDGSVRHRIEELRESLRAASVDAVDAAAA
jgi:F-type H+-transporting ATPase subunit delta